LTGDGYLLDDCAANRRHNSTDPEVFRRRFAPVFHFFVADLGALIEAAEACFLDCRDCTKTSLPPLSGWINPNPLVALNHFTVPVATSTLPFETTETAMSAGQACRKQNLPA
jgi:hypothetical protein